MAEIKHWIVGVRFTLAELDAESLKRPQLTDLPRRLGAVSLGAVR